MCSLSPMMSLSSSPALPRTPSFRYGSRTLKSPCLIAISTSTSCSTSSLLDGDSRSHSALEADPPRPSKLPFFPRGGSLAVGWEASAKAPDLPPCSATFRDTALAPLRPASLCRSGVTGLSSGDPEYADETSAASGFPGRVVAWYGFKGAPASFPMEQTPNNTTTLVQTRSVLSTKAHQRTSCENT